MMIKKIDILGMSLDNYTVREAIRQVEIYLNNNVLNTIEQISLKMLMDAQKDDQVKEVIASLDLSIIGEKEILQASQNETMQRIKETEENEFFFEFFKRVERNKKTVFLLGNTSDKNVVFTDKLKERYPKILMVGETAVEECSGDIDMIVNDMNALAPDVVVSILPSPAQEYFFLEHRDKINTNIWYGIGDKNPWIKKQRLKGWFQSLIHRGKLKKSITKYDAENEEQTL